MPEESGFPGVASMCVDTWKMKARQHFLMPMIPDRFCPKIGAVAIAWSHFETLFENVLVAIMKASGITKPPHRLRFKQRRELLTKKLPEVLSHCPTAVTEITAVLDAMGPLSLKRNFVVHGRLASEMRGVINPDGTKDTEVKLVCVRHDDSGEVVEKFTVEELDDLFYDIGALSGHLHAISSGHLPLPPSSPEIPLLRAFLTTNHPTYPTPAKLVLPPSPSPVSGEQQGEAATRT